LKGRWNTLKKEVSEAAGEKRAHRADEGILTAFLLNFLFVLIEIAGGLFTNSIAILSDAIHDLGDCAAIGFAYVLEKLSKRKADDRYTYGYLRYSLISALVTAAILVAGSALVIYSSIRRLAAPEEVRAPAMLVIAVLGVLVNGAAVLKTAHGHSANERVISLHMLEDVLGWAAVLVGSALIWITKQPIIDPILSICVAVYILWHAFANIRNVMLVLLERAPVDFDTASYRQALETTEGVAGLHHLHVWSLDGEVPVATMHAVVPGELTVAAAETVRQRILETSEHFGVHHATIQLEAGAEPCRDSECHMEDVSEEHSHGHEHHHHHHH